MPDWLPAPIPYADFGGDWERFIEEVYNCFVRDFLNDANRRQLRFEGVLLNLPAIRLFAEKKRHFGISSQPAK